MKRLKSINFKALFIDHGEKFGLALIMIVVLLALGRTSWSRYAGTPEDLDKKAKDARQRFTSPTGNPWPKEKIDSFKVVDFNDRANQLFSKPDLTKFEFLTPMTQPLYRRRELAREPEYLPVEYVIAHPGRAILGVSATGSQSDAMPVVDGGLDAATGLPAAGASAAESENGFRPAGRTGAAGAGAGATPGAGHAAGATMRPPVAMTTAPAGAHATGMPGDMMHGAGGASSNVVARGVRYIAVRGVFPLKQQLEKYQKALNVSLTEASTMFELLDFVLERQAAEAGAVPWKDPSKDENWEVVNIESALDVLREASDFELDPVKTGVTDAVITMSLPHRLLEFWGDHATHPNVRDFQLKPEEMERELKLLEQLKEEYEKAKLDSESKVRRRGLSREQSDPRQMGMEMMASPSASHNMDNMMRGMAAPASDGGAATKMTVADIKERLTANGRLLLFRYFDFDVQPGLAYRYRVKLKMRNPNFERQAAELVDPALALGAERETAYSNISMPAVVPTSVNYFLKDVERDPSRDDKVRASKAVANISMFEWDTKLGTMLHDTLKILSVGQFIAEKKKTIVINAAEPSYKDDVEVSFVTGDVLLDASGDFDILPDQHPDLGLRPEKGRANVRLGLLPEAIVMTSLGEMKQLDPASEKAREQALKKRVDAERNEFKDLKGAANQTGGPPTGGNAYDQMLDMGGGASMPKAPGKKSPKKKGSEAGGAGNAHSGSDSGSKAKTKRSMPMAP